MICDLHTHTNHSDGSVSTDELVRLAKEKNLIIALTDHNTVTGLPSFLAEAERLGVTAVGGTELTTEYNGREFHLIGLFIDPEYYDDVENLCQNLLHRKEICNRDLVDKLRAMGYDIDYDEIKKRNLKGNANRAHIAAELVERGYVASVREAFAGLLEESCGLYKPYGRLKLCDAIDFLRGIHAVPVLAHPLKDITPDELRAMLPELIPHGLVAIETMHSSYSDETIEVSKEIARDFGLLESGGSDFHGFVKPGVSLGVGRGNLNIGEEYYYALMARK
jgi:predicted metal-dependent phosphoesterase TrpH